MAELDAVTPTVTPAEAPALPVATPAPETQSAGVTLTKEQHDQLLRDAARGASHQRKAQLYDNMTRKNGGHFAPQAPVTPPSQEEMEASARVEDDKASRSLMAIAADPNFREVLDADPTLRNLFLTNPLAVLPMLAPDALDAEDATNLVREALNSLKKPVAPVNTPPVVPAPVSPTPGAINLASDQVTNEAVETAKKIPNTEHAIAGMVAAKMGRGK